MFTVKDLRTGMVCLHRGGRYSFVVRGTFECEDNVIFHSGDRTGLDSFDNVSFKWHVSRLSGEQTEHVKSVDIIKVFKPNNVCNGVVIFENKTLNTSSWKVLWQEDETEEMTLSQVCKLLGKKIKIVE